jgi:ribosomal protein S18 acetylase RimI-like enzyme
VDDQLAGATNLARFVAATAGRHGAVGELAGGLAVAGPVAVTHGYVNAAFPVDSGDAPAAFLPEALTFFGGLARPFVLWVPEADDGLLTAAVTLGGERKSDHAPAMAIHRRPVWSPRQFRVRPADSSDDYDTFGKVSEAGYETPGMAWLQARHGYDAPGVTWAIVRDGSHAVGVACGFTFGETGGVYYVATPPEYRGRGIAAVATSWVTNALFDQGAKVVTLQSSRAGFGVYERLGFHVYGHYERYTFEMPRGSSLTGDAG